MGKRKRPRKSKVIAGPQDNLLYKELSDKLAIDYDEQSITHQVLRDGVIEKTKEYISFRATPIYWGIAMDETLYSMFFTRFIALGVMPFDSFGTTEATYLPAARNNIHNGFLDIDAPFMMMLDSDIMAPPPLVNTLLAHNKDVVCGWYKNKNRGKEPHPIVYDWHSESEDGTLNWKHRKSPGKGLEKVDGIGAGCILMSRKAAEALGESPYSMAGGTEDLVMSRKLMNLGIPIYVDWQMELAHIGVSYV